MPKYVNPALVKTNRRNVLRGSLLAGAAAMTAGAGMAGTASKRMAPHVAPRPAAPKFILAEAEAQVAAP